MAKNRPEEDLRHRLNELEATVRGLTQELVEANERIRQLETEPDESPDPDRTTAGSEAPSDPEDRTQDDDAETVEDDIIIA